MESHETSALKPGGRYTLEDYKGWPEDERWELIYGFTGDTPGAAESLMILCSS